MIAVSNNIQERSIKFGSSSLINLSSPWDIIDGTGTITSNYITLNSNSTCALTLNNVNKKVTYFKIVCNITSSDTTLNTKYSKNISLVCDVTYTDSNVKNTTEIFFPNFDFEDDFINNTVVEMSDDTINNIVITIRNEEETSINITEVGLYYITKVNNNNINEIMSDTYESNPTDFNNMMEEYFSNNPLLIPLETTVPAVGTKPAGYIFRLF